MPGYGCWPTAKTFNFVLNLLVNTRNFDVIHEVYVSAGSLGVEIDVCCLNIMIKWLCKNGDVDAARQVFDEMPKQGCRPNVRTFSALVHGLCENNHVEEAFSLLAKMESEGVEPDTILMNILISGLRKHSRVGVMQGQILILIFRMVTGSSFSWGTVFKFLTTTSLGA
ncbi:putative tetratricopeptide-like helical domain superfamily [Helianthus annuus]|uniref:Putative pentatricopeptide repeat protein n=1 Tax=Helianthus annuus TaxID=4232 RepID=A0A251V9M5_HELAN|nr:putative tetratricopeptide-like helical domain superfamily [Helianthus annuus]KAJ0600753.1 putative tetratricopeptide-like helical domain superfamily [Helianthus annuus]KAJ0768074.1 putative tetratricopeptide-like helical domain superfamily [Helianthus annuus]KAJ0773851.1 putative tetratricopeptide-like helical domain superfamily [Helianthus annuus]KAJ0935596.1 putative tetratricopeptide-like helical domain superfamily [Helianthus annuus]